MFETPEVQGPHDPRARAAAALDWREQLRIIRRRRWPAITVFVVALAAAWVHAYSRVPTYQARVRLIIESDRTNLTGLQDPLEGERTTTADFQTQFTILQSRSLARRTMESLGIWDPPPAAASSPEVVDPPRGSFQAALKTAAQVARDTWQSLQQLGAPSPPPRPEMTETAAETARIDGFLTGMRVVPLPNSRLVDVFYESTDPVAAASYANALVSHFIQQNLELKSNATKEAAEWLSDRLAEQRRALDASEQALQSYRDQHKIATPDQSSVSTQKLNDLVAAYTKAKSDRIEKQAQYQQLQSAAGDRAALDAIPAVQGNAFLQQLKTDLVALQRQQAQLAQKLGDRHPTLIKSREAVQAAQARFDSEVVKVVEAVRRDYVAAQATEDTLNRLLEAQRRETISQNRNDVSLAVLQRDAESNRQIYNSLLQRMNEFSVTRERRGDNIRVIDPAEVPQAPSGVGARRDLRYGALGGMLLAVCVVFLLEYLDNRIKNPKQIEQELGLSFLGLVPLENDRREDARLLTAAAPRFAEAFRGIRTNVRLSIAANGGARVVVVTSANAGEGKTVVAANLAMALAQADQRVLLIDADLRRPRQQEVFELEQEPGLSNLLIGDAPAASVIHRTVIPGLHLLPAGTIPPNPSELLESKRYAHFIAELGKNYDWAVIDSPPVLPVTDAVVIADRASAVLLVTSADITPIHAGRAALDHLRAARTHVIGAVLNRVDLDRHAYYYEHYYQQDYESYYRKAAVTL